MNIEGKVLHRWATIYVKLVPPENTFENKKMTISCKMTKIRTLFFVNLKKQLFLSTLVFGLKYSHLLILTNNIFLGAL